MHSTYLEEEVTIVVAAWSGSTCEHYVGWLDRYKFVVKLSFLLTIMNSFKAFDFDDAITRFASSKNQKQI